jgi:hypothetical protein
MDWVILRDGEGSGSDSDVSGGSERVANDSASEDGSDSGFAIVRVRKDRAAAAAVSPVSAPAMAAVPSPPPPPPPGFFKVVSYGEAFSAASSSSSTTGGGLEHSDLLDETTIREALFGAAAGCSRGAGIDDGDTVTHEEDCESEAGEHDGTGGSVEMATGVEEEDAESFGDEEEAEDTESPGNEECTENVSEEEDMECSCDDEEDGTENSGGEEEDGGDESESSGEEEDTENSGEEDYDDEGSCKEEDMDNSCGCSVCGCEDDEDEDKDSSGEEDSSDTSGEEEDDDDDYSSSDDFEESSSEEDDTETSSSSEEDDTETSGDEEEDDYDDETSGEEEQEDTEISGEEKEDSDGESSSEDCPDIPASRHSTDPVLEATASDDANGNGKPPAFPGSTYDDVDDDSDDDTTTMGKCTHSTDQATAIELQLEEELSGYFPYMRDYIDTSSDMEDEPSEPVRREHDGIHSSSDIDYVEDDDVDNEGPDVEESSKPSELARRVYDDVDSGSDVEESSVSVPLPYDPNTEARASPLGMPRDLLTQLYRCAGRSFDDEVDSAIEEGDESCCEEDDAIVDCQEEEEDDDDDDDSGSDVDDDSDDDIIIPSSTMCTHSTDQATAMEVQLEEELLGYFPHLFDCIDTDDIDYDEDVDGNEGSDVEESSKPSELAGLRRVYDDVDSGSDVDESVSVPYYAPNTESRAIPLSELLFETAPKGMPRALLTRLYGCAGRSYDEGDGDSDIEEGDESYGEEEDAIVDCPEEGGGGGGEDSDDDIDSGDGEEIDHNVPGVCGLCGHTVQTSNRPVELDSINDYDCFDDPETVVRPAKVICKNGKAICIVYDDDVEQGVCSPRPPEATDPSGEAEKHVEPVVRRSYDDIDTDTEDGGEVYGGHNAVEEGAEDTLEVEDLLLMLADDFLESARQGSGGAGAQLGARKEQLVLEDLRRRVAAAADTLELEVLLELLQDLESARPGYGDVDRRDASGSGGARAAGAGAGAQLASRERALEEMRTAASALSTATQQATRRVVAGSGAPPAHAQERAGQRGVGPSTVKLTSCVMVFLATYLAIVCFGGLYR